MNNFFSFSFMKKQVLTNFLAPRLPCMAQFLGFFTQLRMFTASHGLVDLQYKSTKLLQQNFTANSYFLPKTQNFPIQK